MILYISKLICPSQLSFEVFKTLEVLLSDITGLLQGVRNFQSALVDGDVQKTLRGN